MTTTFASLGLAEPLLRAVSEEGYETPTPIQAQAIPQVIAGGDLLAAAQTGTGKTAGFTLPILHRLHEKHARPGKPGQPRVLILTPTRELAAQVEESVKTYGRHLKFTTTLVFGGVGIVPQIQRLKRPIDILVATPGRLLDHVSQRTVDLSAVETLVLDEADRMLDMGFIRDIRKVLALLPEGRQNLLFSATYSDDIKGLAAGLLKDPVLIEVARKNPASELVAQAVHMVDKDKKKDLLAYLIREENWTQALVFTRTKHGANKLAEQLTKSGIMADAIHGNKSQSARTRALADFKGGQLRILVATDIAARGLDIDLLPQVVNFELPQVPEDYVHRIGRTGRAGSEGKAVSLVCGEEMKLLRDIERVLRRPIPRQEVDGFTAEQIPVPLPDPRALRAQRHAETNKPLGYRKGSPAQARAEGQRSRPQGDRPSGRPNGPRPERRDGQQNRPAGSGQVRTGSQGEVRNPGRWSRPEGAEGRSEGRSEARPLTGRPFGGHVKPTRPAGPRNSDNRGGASRRPGAPRRRED